MRDGLQQQVDEHSQLLRLATSQETQNDGGAGGGAGLPLELTACFTAQTPKQEPVSLTEYQRLKTSAKTLLVLY